MSNTETLIKIPIYGHPFTTSAYEPMVRLNMDLIGLHSESRYILVIIGISDLYKYNYADVKETAIALFKHYGRFGAPFQIMSDRGSHFVNHVIQEFLVYAGTEHCLPIAYAKEESAIVERANK